MSKYCAKRVNSANRSLVDEFVFLLESHTENIDLSGRRVDPAIFPAAQLKASSQEILRTMGPEALQYSSSHDYMPLKQELCKRYNRFGLELTPENFTITNGSIQAIDMLMKVLVNEGDTILTEAPIAWRVRQTMSMYRPNVIEVPVLADGVDTDELERLLKETKPKFFYCSPNYHEPTGIVYSVEKRDEIARLSREYECIIVEQDSFSELFPDESRPPYTFPNTNEYGILIGSISQLVGPGLRVGWVVCTHPVLMKYFTEAKQKTDSHCNGLIQRLLWHYLANTSVADKAADVRELYNEKRAVALAAAKILEGKAKVNVTAGATFMWISLPDGADSIAFAKKAAEAGVNIVPGKLFGDSTVCDSSIYLNFAGATAEQIEKSFAILDTLL